MGGKVIILLLLIFLEVIIEGDSLSLPYEEKDTAENIRLEEVKKKLVGNLLGKKSGDEKLSLTSSEDYQDAVAANILVLKLNYTVRSKRDVPQQENNATNVDNICKRHTFEVEFSDLDMDGVIAPRGDIDVGICRGRCSTEVATSAACRMARRPYTPSCPPCAVIEYEPISILYEDLNDIGVQTLSDLVISKCGCLN